MPALQGLIDGFLTAAELATLLFVSPVSATEQSRIEAAPTAPADRTYARLASAIDFIRCSPARLAGGCACEPGLFATTAPRRSTSPGACRRLTNTPMRFESIAAAAASICCSSAPGAAAMTKAMKTKSCKPV